MRIKEGFEMVDGLFIGLVYGGREDGGKGDDGGDVQGCGKFGISSSCFHAWFYL